MKWITVVALLTLSAASFADGNCYSAKLTSRQNRFTNVELNLNATGNGRVEGAMLVVELAHHVNGEREFTALGTCLDETCTIANGRLRIVPGQENEQVITVTRPITLRSGNSRQRLQLNRNQRFLLTAVSCD